MILKSLFPTVLAALLAAPLAWGAEPVKLASPDGRLVAAVEVADGQPSYKIDWRGRPLVLASKLGLDLEGKPFSGTYEMAGYTASQHDETWKPPYGERTDYRNHYNEAAIEFRDAQPPHRILKLVFRAYDEGIAFRYVLPEQPGLGELRQQIPRIQINGEHSEFRFPADHPAWATYAAQGQYSRIPVSQIKPGCERPLVLEAGTDTYVALGEAGLIDFARMKFAPLGNGQAGVVSRLEGKVSLPLRMDTPWRVVMVAESPGKLLENNGIFLNLNEPCALADTSWIKPGKVLREVTLTTQGGKACIDFAVKHNLQYILFDAGWYGPENSPKSDATAVNLDPARSKGPLDLPEVIRYGNEHGVGVILYINYVAMRRQLDAFLPLYRAWGVKGVKYGFVGVGSQDHTDFVAAAIRKAAANQLMVDIHDEYRPTGYGRTYPNLMTVEGILGDEESKRSNAQSLVHLFSRFLCGPADNTLCYYDARVDRLCSHAYQLAKSVCFYSPLQHLYWYDRPAGSPQKAAGAGGAAPQMGDEPETVFFDRLPTVWDETRVVEGKIGECAIVARRSGDTWFVGCMNNATARTLKLPLGFLPAGKACEATRFSDDKAVPTRTHVKIETLPVDAGMTLDVPLAANGGAAFIITPKKD